MMLNIYLQSLLSHQPAIGVVRWEDRDTLQRLLAVLPRHLKAAHGGKGTLRTIAAADMSSEQFGKAVVTSLRNAAEACLIIYDIESFAGLAGSILNGQRERLGLARAILLCIRTNRFRDFALEAPDVMSWVGNNVAQATDFNETPLRSDVKKSLRLLETKYGMTTSAFLARSDVGKATGIPDAWIWRELATMDRNMRDGAIS